MTNPNIKDVVLPEGKGVEFGKDANYKGPEICQKCFVTKDQCSCKEPDYWAMLMEMPSAVLSRSVLLNLWFCSIDGSSETYEGKTPQSAIAAAYAAWKEKDNVA